MTVIIGYVDKKENITYMCSDTLVTHSDFTKYNLKTKIQRFDEHNILIGYAGSLAPIHAVRMNLTFESREEGVDAFEYVSREIAPNISAILDDVLRDDDSFGAIVAVDGKLFEIDERGLVVESSREFHAMGSGEKVALGSLLTTRDTDMSTVDKLSKALEVTSEVIFNVAPPFVFEII